VIPLTMPTINKDMENAVIDVINNEMMVGGESVYKFEEEFAKYVGTDYAASVNSGSSAILLTFHSLNIKNGQKVIAPSATFIATLNGPTILGGVPVFCEIGQDYVISAKSLLDHSKWYDCKFIIPVHLYGQPCDIPSIQDLVKNNNMTIIEDVAQAHGAKFKGKRAGSFGEASIFSFYPTKNMTVGGDGGMVTTNNKRIYESVVKMRDVGRRTKYTHDLVGYTIRLNSVNAAIGRVQLRHLEEWNEKRRSIASNYNKNLDGIDGLILPPAENATCEPVYHIYAVRTKKRNLLGTWLKMNGISTGVHYPVPVHKQPAYQQYQNLISLKYTEEWSNTILSIPMYPNLTGEDQKLIIDMIQKFYNEKLYGLKNVKEAEKDWAEKLI
jgi:perosamine synthetase